MSNLYIIIIILFMPIAGYTQNIDALVMLQSRAVTYYNDGDYSNSIILYEDLLAEQEIIYGKEDIRVAETLNRLGELYLYTDLSDVSDYYFNEAIIIFQNAFQAGKNALEMPLMNLLKIYTFKNDSIMMRNIEQRLHSISTIFQSPSSIYPEFQFDADTLYSPEEDLALDKMNLGYSYLDHGLYSEAVIQFNEALDSQTENLDLQFFEDFFPSDTLLAQNMMNALFHQVNYDTTGASYFFLALFSSTIENASKYIQDYIQLQPLDMRGSLLYANLLFNNGEWLDALFQYRRTLWVNSDNFDAQVGIGLCLYHMQKYKDAVDIMKKALKIDPYNHSTYYYLGISSMAENNYEEAIASLTRSLLLDPDNSDTYFNLGKSYYESGKIIQAQEAFNRVINIDFQYGPAYYYLGLINENIMEIEKAVESYAQAREYSPKIEDVHLRLGMLLYRTGELKKAMEPLREFIIYQPDSIYVLEAMGDIFISESRFQEAIDTYKRIREKNPENLDVNLALAESYYQLKEFEMSLDIYKDVLLFNDENVDVMIIMGNIYNDMGRYEEAENIFIDAINCTNHPTMQMYYQLAMTFGNQGEFMSTILALQEALALAPDDVELKYQMAVAYMELYNFIVAAKYLEEYVSQHPKDEIAFFLLGKCYYKTSDYPAALLALQLAKKLLPNDHRILYYLGKSYSGLGEDADAALTFRKALKIEPEDPEIYFALGKSYYRLNKNKKVNETLDILNMLDRSLYEQLYSEVGIGKK